MSLAKVVSTKAWARCAGIEEHGISQTNLPKRKKTPSRPHFKSTNHVRNAWTGVFIEAGMIDSPSFHICDVTRRRYDCGESCGSLALVLEYLTLSYPAILETEALYLAAAAADLPLLFTLGLDIRTRCSSLLISTSTSNHGWRDTQ
jgi:hypothetical protein